MVHHRTGRIVACVLAAVGVFGGLRLLGEGRPGGMVVIAAQVFVAASVTLPTASRAWFRPPA
ncbi:hypothetical protein GCM10020218_024980 [Dactylosporangium vinaceum]